MDLGMLSHTSPGNARAPLSPSGHTLAIKRVPIESLVPDPANARAHPERNLESVVASLRRFGQAEPLIVQAGTLRVIGGHARLTAMKSLGWTECDIVELEIENLDATALGIALNRTAELATWDEPVLAKLLFDLRAEDALEGLGFEELEIEGLISRAGLADGLDGDLDLVPGLPETATTRSGDLWVLGRHRLLCGDSADPADVDKLVAGAPIHLVNTDAPYNVKVEPRSNNAIAAGLSSFTGTTHHQGLDLARHPGKAKATHDKLRPKDRPLQNDFVSDEEFARLLRAWYGNAARVLLPGRAFYCWGGYANLANYPGALAESGLYFSQAIVWDKCHPVLTRKDFMGAFELAFYGWREGAAHEYFGPNNATDLWEVKKLNHTAMVHLTEKPVELAIRAIQYSSRPGENVLDLFGGSGSTLIGAEETGRRAFLMEIDLLYCDVIIERWQQRTGEKATLLGTNQTFDAVKVERGAA
jgi:DNA modification methylase